MPNNFTKIFIAIFIFISSIILSQNKNAKITLAECKNASDSMTAYLKLMEINETKNFSTSKNAASKIKSLYTRNKNDSMYAKMYEYLANSYWYNGDFTTAMDLYLKQLELGEKIDNKPIIASSKYNIGWIKTLQLHQKENVSYFYEALSIFKETKDTSYILQVSSALGSYYRRYSNEVIHTQDSCLKYFKYCINLSKNSNFSRNIAGSITNLASFYFSIGDIENTRKYCYEAIRFTKNKENFDEYNYVGAYTTLIESLSSTDSVARVNELIKILAPYWKNSINDMARVSYYASLVTFYENNKLYKNAFEYHVAYKNLSDSINQKTFNDNLTQKENIFKIEKKDKELNELHLKAEIDNEKNKKNKFAIIVLFSIVLIILISLFFVFKNYKAKQKINIILEEQNKIISHKKLEIEQSIEYAKGIQEAVLPDLSDLNLFFSENAIFYLPKDVVSGDFYWYHVINQHEIIIACADCTGHGVPGCLMSIVSIDKLNSTLFEKKITEPDKILFNINNQIKDSLKHKKDGLDIALIHYNKDTKKIKYSGANRPLWIIKNNTLFEHKATKTSIAGHTEKNKIFELKEIQLELNDVIVLSTDGYADQFGGSKANGGKKMMTSKFKTLLTELSHKKVQDINISLVQNFQNWKGNYEQVDDVCVIVFRV